MGGPAGAAVHVRLPRFLRRHDEKPAYSLNENVQAQAPGGPAVGGPFTMFKTVPLPLATLRSGNYAIIVRASPADGGDDLFCGDTK